MAMSVLPVFLFTIYLVQSRRLDAVFTNLRCPRTKIYLFTGLCTAVGCVVLAYSGAPPMLLVAFIAGL